MEQYIKNMNQIDIENVKTSCLLQLKSYFKIIGISYLLENMNTSLISDVVKTIIKNNHIFNNIAIISKPRVIKVLPKLDMAIIWLDIWDTQSGSKAKGLINRCFNIRSFIVIVQGANINLGISQCKNCWKWRYATFLYRIQGSKCTKCNNPYKSKHYHHFS